MDVIFLSRIIPENMPEVAEKRINTMTTSGESLMWRIIKGLDYHLDKPVKLLNYLPVQSYPTSYPEPYITRSYFSHVDGSNDINLPFCNIKYIKRLFMGISLNKEIKKWGGINRTEKKVIISYSLSPESTEAMKIAKSINPNIITCAIVADLPEYTILTNTMNLPTKVYLNWMKSQTNKRLEFIDKFVLLTEAMAEKLVTDQDYIIMEGISTKKQINQLESNSTINIIYAGTLNERFGIIHLLNAFMKTKNPQYRLEVCGIGDSEKKILDAKEKDNRIVFYGQLPQELVLDKLSNASVIVNPRRGLEEFTKYSFPSKNLEALSMGIPLVAYKLPGIPDEYDTFINYPDNESEEALATIIDKIIDDKHEEFSKKAVKAKQWVENEKNNITQSKRILELIDNDFFKK